MFNLMLFWVEKQLTNQSFVGRIKNEDVIFFCQSQKNSDSKRCLLTSLFESNVSVCAPETPKFPHHT